MFRLTENLGARHGSPDNIKGAMHADENHKVAVHAITQRENRAAAAANRFELIVGSHDAVILAALAYEI